MSGDAHETFDGAFGQLTSELWEHRNESIEYGGLVVQASDGWRISNLVSGDAGGIDWSLNALQSLNSTNPIYALSHTHTNVNGSRFSGSASPNIANEDNGDIGVYRALLGINSDFRGVFLIHSGQVRVTRGTPDGSRYGNASDFLD